MPRRAFERQLDSRHGGRGPPMAHGTPPNAVHQTAVCKQQSARVGNGRMLHDRADRSLSRSPSSPPSVCGESGKRVMHISVSRNRTSQTWTGRQCRDLETLPDLHLSATCPFPRPSRPSATALPRCGAECSTRVSRRVACVCALVLPWLHLARHSIGTSLRPTGIVESSRLLAPLSLLAGCTRHRPVSRCSCPSRCGYGACARGRATGCALPAATASASGHGEGESGRGSRGATR
mmetsp:Transcript_42524/g.140898  ORF Transcript_42524/g.140898 Transcript_42524/m.140898 type:complete len:235 (-) Transcript_42524:12-716(-)